MTKIDRSLWSVRRLAWALGCSARGSTEESMLERELAERVAADYVARNAELARQLNDARIDLASLQRSLEAREESRAKKDKE